MQRNQRSFRLHTAFQSVFRSARTCVFFSFTLTFIWENETCDLMRNRYGKSQVYESTVLQVLMKRPRFASY